MDIKRFTLQKAETLIFHSILIVKEWDNIKAIQLVTSMKTSLTHNNQSFLGNIFTITKKSQLKAFLLFKFIFFFFFLNTAEYYNNFHLETMSIIPSIQEKRMASMRIVFVLSTTEEKFALVNLQ